MAAGEEEPAGEGVLLEQPDEEIFEDSGGKPDPCPVTALGHAQGDYHFITPAGEYRKLTHRDVTSHSGLASLFHGDFGWAADHFAAMDREGNPTRRPNWKLLGEYLIRACTRAGHFDEDLSMRGPGTWRCEGGRAIVHCGDRLAVLSSWPQTSDAPMPLVWRRPGEIIDGALFRLGARIQAPRVSAQRDLFDRDVEALDPAPPEYGDMVVEHLMRWHHAEGRAQAQLLAGAVASMMLGGLPPWRANVFLLGLPGGGKSALVDSVAAIMGGAAQKAAKTYSEAWLRQRFNGEARTLLLDEADSKSARERIGQVIELIRSMTDGSGARGGRGGLGPGRTQTYELIAPVLMAANMHDPLRPADAQRITRVRILPIESGRDAGSMLREREELADMSGALRARMLRFWPLWRHNFAVAVSLLSQGGAHYARQTDQLGYFCAGFWTMTSDHPRDASVETVDWLMPWLEDLATSDDGDPMACLQWLFSWSADLWRSGHKTSIGDLVAHARLDDGRDQRSILGTMGLKLVQRAPGAAWSEAWLAIANVHASLMPVFAQTDWSQQRWSQMLGELEAAERGKERFAGAQSRCVLVPPWYLPSFDTAPAPQPGDGIEPL